MWVGEIDVHDDDLVKRFWEAGRLGDVHEREYSTYWSLQEAAVAFRAEGQSSEQHAVAAMEDGEVLGACQVVLPMLDNRHLAYAEPLVPPAHRGRGVGSALLQAALELVRSAGRTTVVSEANLPLDGSDTVGSAWAERRGFRQAIVEVHRVLEIPLSKQRLGELADDCAPHHEGYRLVTFGDTVPDEHLEGFCTLQIAFNEEAPGGDLDIEAEHWDEDRVRKGEARMRDQGRHLERTVVLAPDGELVALTELMATDHLPELAYQSGTLVLSHHRGRRLGMASKVANLRSFQARFPDVRTVHSWNAEENGPMVAINETLGFRPVERLAEMQLKLTDVPTTGTGGS